MEFPINKYIIVYNTIQYKIEVLQTVKCFIRDSNRSTFLNLNLYLSNLSSNLNVVIIDT